MFQGKRGDKPKEYEFYNPADPAFEQESGAFSYDQWADTGDMAHLPIKSGMTPWRFVLRQLSSAEKAWIRDRANDGGNTLFWWAVAMSLRTVVTPDGNSENVGRETFRNWSVAESDWMDAIAEDDELLSAMAAIVIKKELRPDPKS